MAITVCISIDDAGAISVGEEPQDGAMDAQSGQSGMTDLAEPPDAAASGMQPARSIDDALAMARDMLRTATQQGGAIVATPGGADQQDAAGAAFAANRGQ